MRTALLSTKQDVEQFAGRYLARSGMGIELDYLKRASVRGLFDHDQRLVGGITLNVSWPLRYQSVLPDTISLARLVPLGEACEITGAWIEPQVGKAGRFLLFGSILLDILRSGKTVILGGATKRSLERIQTRALPNTVYTGPGHFGAHTREIYLHWGTPLDYLGGLLSETWSRLLRSIRPSPRHSISTMPPGTDRST